MGFSGVPMAISGALIPLFFGVATVNIYTQVGLLTLIGLISKHGILIVEFANELQLKEGLDKRSAIEMAAQMVYGAASMVLATGRHPAALKDDVTTPAGCTIAGILALEDGRIRSVLSRAVEVASVRAGELASSK